MPRPKGVAWRKAQQSFLFIYLFIYLFIRDI
jgi:hypothetical protein